MPALDPWQAPVDEIRTRLRSAGIVGLGGAGFPTADKLGASPAVLILNGAECEPYISCDDALLREHALDVVQGGRLLARLGGAAHIVLAVEESMPAAHAAFAAGIAASESGDIDIVRRRKG